MAAIESTPGAPPASQCGKGGPAPSVTKNGGGITGNNGGPGAGSGSGPGSASGGGSGSGAGSGTGPGSGTGAGSGTGSGTGAASTAGGAVGATSAQCTSATSAVKSKPPSGSKTAPATGQLSTTKKPVVTAATTTVPCRAPKSQAAAFGSANGGPGNPVLQVNATGNGSGSPTGNQALWWVLGGFVIAAGTTGIAGLTRRDST